MKSDRHICLLTPGFPADEQDSTCIPPLQLYLKALKALHPNWRISVIALQYPHKEIPYSWNGLQVFPMNGKNKGFPFRLLTWEKAKKAFRNLHQQNPVDCLHALWLNEAALVAQQLAKKFSLPLLTTIMGQDPLPDNKYLKHLKWERMKVVSITERAAQHFRRNTGQEVETIIPWGLPQPKKTEISGWEDRAFDILCVGSHVPVKAFHRVPEILQKMGESSRNLRVGMIGAGMKAGHFKWPKNLTPEPEFLGSIPHKEVLSKMKEAKILLHPAKYEGQGFVFEEALSHGMVIVSKPVGSAANGPRWKTGLTDEELAVCLISFLKEKPVPKQELRFAVQRTAEQYSQVFQNLIKWELATFSEMQATTRAIDQ